jgi:hypothetical protein
VPVATPPPPVELDQVTCDTPALSCAVPLTTMELAEVATVVMEGDRMVMEGGAVSPAVPGLGGVVVVGFPEVGFPEVGLSAGGFGSWLVTVTLSEAWSCFASDAVTVIAFAPTFKGMVGMDQFTDPCAGPAAPWFVDQFTCTDPEPPDVVPLSPMDAALVVEGGA